MATKQELQQKTYKRFVDAVDLIAHKGYSVNSGTKEVGMSKNTFRSMNKERGNLLSNVYDPEKKTKSGKSKVIRYEVDERFAYVQNMPVIVLDANGKTTTVQADFDKYFAGIIGKYWNEIRKVEQAIYPDFSAIPDVIYDRYANPYILVKDLDDIISFLQVQTDDYMAEIWKRFHSEKRKAVTV